MWILPDQQIATVSGFECKRCIEATGSCVPVSQWLYDKQQSVAYSKNPWPLAEQCYHVLHRLCPTSERAARLAQGGACRTIGYRLFSKILNSIVGVIGSAFFVVILPFVALLIKAQSRGPVLFIQERVGLNGSTFRLIKFRTMHPQTQPGEAHWANEDEDRIFPFGRFLRSARLDEVPQFLNVLMGSMSFIGPRPEQVPIVERLRGKIPNYALRHQVLPGITGWAQVRYRYGWSELDAWLKLSYDLYYLENANLWLDLRIIAETLKVVLRGRGAR